MTDWLDEAPRTNRRGGEAERAQALTGQVWREAAHPPQAPPARSLNDLPRRAEPYGPDVPPQFDGNIGGGDGGGRAPRGRFAAARPSRRRRLRRMVTLLIAVLVVTSGGTYAWADFKLNREVDLGKLADRPPQGKGINYLIVGSDSREGLSEQARKDLHTGGSADAGRRTDSMILLHTGAHGTTMTSLPRDSWVTIPSYIRPDTGKHYPVEEQAQRGVLARRPPPARPDHRAQHGSAH